LIVAAQGDLIDAIDHAAERGHAWVVPYWALVQDDPGAVETAAHSGLEVIVWGLEEPSEVATLVLAGVGGLVVDDPPAFAKALDLAG
jgi:glycerophosphoryl diester phosphodiesterase